MKKVPAYGPSGARIAIVGEAPGAQEVHAGRPFVGPAGTLLRDFLQEVGIDPEEVYYTNVCKYKPPDNKLEKWFLDSGVPNSIVIEGLKELEEELHRLNPHIVLACGNFALWALTGKARWVDRMQSGKRVRGYTGISDWRGSLLHGVLWKGKVLPTYHPSYILQEGRSDHGAFKVDLARLRRESAFPELKRPKREIIVVGEEPRRLTNLWEVYEREEPPRWEPLDATIQEVEEDLCSTPDVPLTLDIEYIGSKLLCIGVTNRSDVGYVYPTTSIKGLERVKRVIERSRSFNAQNSMFDASILEWHHGVKITSRLAFDTMVASYAANIELPKGLDYLCSIYTDIPYYKDMTDWEAVKKGQYSADVLHVYNGLDVVAQHEIMEEQLRHDLTDPVTKRTFDFLMMLIPPLWAMSKRGIKIDRQLMKEVSAQLKQEADENSLWLAILAKSRELINVKSGLQVSALLYDQLGLPIIKQNKTGPATDDKTLAALSLKATNDEQRRAIELIRKIRSARDLQSKFFNIEFDNDNRMRGHYDPTKTVTGRLASRKFYPTGRGTNQQNIPRDKRARRVFIADPKKVFGYADLERAESLVVAHLTNDPRMLLDHSPGQNAHRNLGALLFNKPAEEIDEHEYYLAKKTRHAGNYMQGYITFMRNVNQDAHKTGVSIEASEAREYIETYKQVHPGLPLWWERVKTQLYKTRTVYNLVGDRRTFYGHIQSCLPEAVAHGPQSTVGVVLNIGLTNIVLDEEGQPLVSPYVEERGIAADYEGIAEELAECGFDLLQQVHDAVGFQCYEKDVDRVVPLLRRGLSFPLVNPNTIEEFRIPVEVMLDLDPERVRFGRSNWGDTKVYTADLNAH